MLLISYRVELARKRPPLLAALKMKHFEDLTAALGAILINRAQRDYECWTRFVLAADRMLAKGEVLAELYGTKLPAWKRQDVKQKGLPTCVAISAPVLGSPGKREFILMATGKVQTAPQGSVWTRETWSDRSIAFGSFVMVKESRQRSDYAWTWRLQEHIYEGIKRNLIRWVKSGNASAILAETQSWLRCYPMFGGVRRQFRKLLMSASKLWIACHRNAWPGLAVEQLPFKIGFSAEKMLPHSQKSKQ